MEIKRTSNTSTENRDTTVVSPLENFPWAALQQSLKGTNILNAINQLLNMYHPDDGIIAYERVLKALLILSENLDNDMQQQIISVVPLPKGVSNDKIRNLIHKTTGLIKPPNSMALYQKITIVPEDKFNIEVLHENAETHLDPNILISTSQNLGLNEKFAPSVPKVFKGFPPNEISTIHSHVRNVNYMYDTLNYNTACMNPYVNVKQNFSSNTNELEESLKLQSKLKWFHAPHILYKTNLYQSTACNYQQDFLKSVDDKYFQLPIDKFNNWNQCNITNVPHPLHQDTTCLKKLYKNSVVSNKQNKNQILNLEVTHGERSSKTEMSSKILHNDSVNQNSKKYNNLNRNRILNVEMQKYFEPRLKDEQQAIQHDTYKMDVVYFAEERRDSIINKQTLEEDFVMDNFMMHKTLKTSLQNFLKRAEQKILMEFPVLPQTKPLPTVVSTSNCCNAANEKNLDNIKNKLDVSNKDRKINKDINISENTKQYIKKKSESGHICSKPYQLEVLHKSLNTVLSKTKTVEYEKKNNIENLLYKSAVKQIKQNNLNTLQQTASITEVATFKKHYYDTLLNIQKAKMAVANSLAISSVESFTKYDPYYSNHSYQQQQLLQHGPLTVNPQFSVHAMTQSGLTNIQNTPYTWVRYNNLRHPTMKQLKLPQQFPLHVSRNKENSILHYVKTVDIQCFTQESKHRKQGIQRKKLEDIVGKLREVENSNTSN